MTKTASLLLPATKSQGLMENETLHDLTTQTNSMTVPMQHHTTKNQLNRLELDGVNLSLENSIVDMSMLSTVHVCAAQVRRYPQKYSI